MEEEMIYWRHPSLPCIKIEEITEGARYKGSTWLDVARQIYCENGAEDYREIGHYPSGAPFLYGSESRISISHCPGLLVVATLAPVPDADMSVYSDKTALGVDAERRDREQVLKLRERFLNEEELEMIPENDVEANILAWTIKEACYKATLTEALDFRRDILIRRMPRIGPAVPVYDIAEYDYSGKGEGFTENDYGRASVMLPAGKEIELEIYSYYSDSFVITLAYTPESSRYNKKH